jgi:hypothetical protein
MAVASCVLGSRSRGGAPLGVVRQHEGRHNAYQCEGG